jgi:hypothetical protein
MAHARQSRDHQYNVSRAVADDQRLEVFHAGKIIPYPRHLDRLHYVVRPGSERPPNDQGRRPE